MIDKISLKEEFLVKKLPMILEKKKNLDQLENHRQVMSKEHFSAHETLQISRSP